MCQETPPEGILLWEHREVVVKRWEVNYIGLSAAISACEKAGQWKAACEVLRFSATARIRVDIVACSAAIAACSRSGEWQQAFGLLEKMAKEQIRQDTVACTAAITACTNSSEWKSALSLLNSMKLRLSPEILAYTAALSACESRRSAGRKHCC